MPQATPQATRASCTKRMVGKWICTRWRQSVALSCGSLLALILSMHALPAQTPWSSLRLSWADATMPVQQLDTLTIAAPLLAVSDSASGQFLPLDIFSLRDKSLLIDTARLQRACPGCTRLLVRYRVLAIDLGRPRSRLDSATVRKAGRDDAIEFDYTPYQPPEPLLGGTGLSSSGAYTRGLSFGNNQNLVFNSNLNLQLEGQLGNDLELRAALSDNTVPLQPDGSTRQLNEFDRVYIQIKRRNTTLTAGDYDLVRPQNSYFSNYFKRLQGAMLEQTGTFGASDTLRMRASAAISRGKFARQNIQGQEGNQGPYRLQGTEGERFIIVLAGTEKVFVDGQLLRRGLNDDYVIDYNLGELTFTQRRLITKDIRIIVEFEYAVQAYLRSTTAANTEWTRGNNLFYFNLYAEQDSRTAGGAQDLTLAERQALAQAGDNLQLAFASGIDTVENAFDPARVFYKSVDTVVCGVAQNILVWSTNPDSAIYTARFSEVPAGQGHYILASTAANGRVYRWVAPDPVTCQPGGNYEPVVRLLAPESRQLLTAGARVLATPKTEIKSEIALSNRDLNRLSPLGNADNTGLAGWTRVQHQLKPVSSPWQATLHGTYEFTNRYFLPVNPYRPAEYVRDWNLDAATDKQAEHIAQSGFSVRKKDLGSLQYDFNAFLREQQYSGIRHAGQGQLQYGGFKATLNANLLESDGNTEKTRFSRPKFDLNQTFFRRDSSQRKARLTIGIYGERERNERLVHGADTLRRNSFWYDMGRFYFKTPEELAGWQWGGSLTQRNDYFPVGKGFRQNTLAREANVNGRWKLEKKSTQSLQWNVSWRQLRIIDAAYTTQQAQETYLGRIDYNLAAWQNTLSFTTGYEVGSGQSPRVEYNYLPVNPGEGQYAWIDHNRDSILQIDEMEIAVFQDQANYVRVAVTTTDYIRTNNTLFNQNLRIDPRVLWGRSEKAWQRQLSRLSVQSTLQLNRKVFAGAGNVSAWNPFEVDIPDTALVNLTATLRNVFFINRAHPVWDLSLAHNEARNRLQVTTGFESRRVGDLGLRGRLNLGRKWNAEAGLTRGFRDSETENFSRRNYAIRYLEAGPKLTWLPGRAFRLQADWIWRDSRNTLDGNEKASRNTLGAEMSWNPAGKANAAGFRAATAIRLRSAWSSIEYDGSANSALAYAMLDGLQNGSNFLWNLSLDRQLSQTMQVSISYEGRKTGDVRTIHVGRAQVRAVF